MFDFEHNWYLGHATDPRFLQEIQSTGLRHSIEDSRINQFQITKETLSKLLEDIKTGNGLHHGQKGISIVQLPKLPGQKRLPSDLFQYVQDSEITPDFALPSRYSFMAIDGTK